MHPAQLLVILITIGAIGGNGKGVAAGIWSPPISDGMYMLSNRSSSRVGFVVRYGTSSARTVSVISMQEPAHGYCTYVHIRHRSYVHSIIDSDKDIRTVR
jgi:hypothetical protein